MRRCRRNTPPARTSEASEPSALSLLAGQILNGIATGMLYALMGLGLSLITGILNIPNFAHGAFFAVGAYLLVTAVGIFGNFWIGLVVAPAGVALLGLAIEYAGIRRLYAAGHDYQLLFTFGLSLILAEGIILLWGPVGRHGRGHAGHRLRRSRARRPGKPARRDRRGPPDRRGAGGRRGLLDRSLHGRDLRRHGRGSPRATSRVVRYPVKKETLLLL